MFIIEDTNFLVSVLKSSDKYHNEAVETLELLMAEDITYVYPQIVLNETIFVLLRNGYSSEIIRKRINKLSMIPKVIIQNTDVLTTLRYNSRYYNSVPVSSNTEDISINGANDFIVACLALDYSALLISNDQRLLKSMSRANAICLDFTKKEQREKLRNILETNTVN